VTAQHESGPRVRLRDVEDADLDRFFADQADAEAARMAAFPTRDRDAFDAHWRRIRHDPLAIVRTVVADGDVAGNVFCWQQDGQRLVGYWISREQWGHGIATLALRLLVDSLPERPLHAHVAAHNHASIRVLGKCGFRRDHEAEAQLPDPEDGVSEHVFVLP